MNITDYLVSRLSLPDSGYKIYRDSKVTGLGVRVLYTGAKTFIFEHRIGKKTKRISLGKYPVMGAPEAKAKATALLTNLSSGISVLHNKLALKDLLDSYLAVHSTLRTRTKIQYKQEIELHLSDYFHSNIKELTPETILKIHQSIESPSVANRVMRVVRALFNFAIDVYPGIVASNPCNRLKSQKAWHRVGRRRSFISLTELPKVGQAIMGLLDLRARYFFLLVMFTGLRLNEALQLRWENINFEQLTLTIPITKNHKPHILPIVPVLKSLLLKLHDITGMSEFLFPSSTRHNKAITTFRYDLAFVCEASGVSFTVHDLRRTFATVCELVGLNISTIKALLNHSSSSDVTSGYIILTVERLIEPLTLITEFIYNCTIPQAVLIKDGIEFVLPTGIVPTHGNLNKILQDIDSNSTDGKHYF